MAPPIWWLKTTELSTGRGGVGRNALGPLEAVRLFRVLVKPEYSRQVSQFLVAGAPGIPYLWSPYVSFEGGEFLSILPLVRIEAAQEDNGEGETIAWLVTCTYTNDLGPIQPQTPGPNDPGSPNSSQNNPEQEPPEIEWGGETMQRAFPTDLNGSPYVNSAKAAFQPAPTIEIGFRTLTYTRNELNLKVEEHKQYSYALNSDEFFGYPAGRVQCYPPVARGVYRSRFYYRVTYKFRFFPELPVIRVKVAGDNNNPVVMARPDWQPHILDVGTVKLVEKQAGGGFLQTALRAGMGNVTQELPLDGNGKRAEIGANGAFTPLFLKFNSYPSKPFAVLMIR